MVVLNDLITDRARAVIAVVARKARVRAGYVFGSQAEGTANELSDIDIAAFIKGTHELGLQGRVRLGVEAAQKAAVPAVELVERPGRHANAVAQAPSNLIQGDLLLGAKDNLVGNVRRPPRT